MPNTFGHSFRITTFGESHGGGVGVVIDGCPPRVEITAEEIQVEENVPWGEDTLFTLEFREESNKYAIHTCNNMYLMRDGKLTPDVNKVNKQYNTALVRMH